MGHTLSKHDTRMYAVGLVRLVHSDALIESCRHVPQCLHTLPGEVKVATAVLSISKPQLDIPGRFMSFVDVGTAAEKISAAEMGTAAEKFGLVND